MSRILITGGAGFIGSHFADQLLQADHEVIIVDDLRHSTTAFVDRRAHLIELDYASDQGLAAIGQLRPEFIFHFAAQIDVRISCEDPIRDAQENIISTLKLIESGLHAGMKYFCFASSGGAIYGEATSPQTESFPEVPLNAYGVAKLAIDKYLQVYAVQKNLRACSLRLANVYGPRQGSIGEGGVVSVFARGLVQGRAPTIFGDGAQTRDFVYVEDLAQLANTLVDSQPQGIFNLGTGVETSVATLAAALADLSGISQSEIRRVAAIAGEQRRSCLSSAKAQRELGFRIATPLAEGLAATFAWCKTQK